MTNNKFFYTIALMNIDRDQEHEEFSRKSDHELLVDIALQLRVTNDVLGLILTDWLNQKVSGVKIHGDSYDGSLGKIAADIHLIRRRLAGSISSDPEEK